MPKTLRVRGIDGSKAVGQLGGAADATEFNLVFSQDTGCEQEPEVSKYVYSIDIVLLYISEPGYQLPVSKLSVCLRSAVNVRDVCRSLS